MLRPLDDEATTEVMTEELSVAGTLPYMSPEELKGDRADHRSDLYSFGVVLYEMATGKRPFEEKLSTALTAAIVQKPPEPPRSHNREVSPGLESIILKALDKDPDHRYQSAREMRVDLERLSVPVSGVVPKRKPVRAARWLRTGAGVVAVLAILLALNVGGLRDALVEEPGPGIDSIAVLPLDNLSGDPEQEYFADGMTEELIAELAKIGALRVISRQSVMQFKGTDQPLPKIAQTLNVDAVVEGSVRRSGNRVRITTQLVQASPEQHLWAESYERDMQDILALQSEVAQAIAREIRITVTPEEEIRMASARPVDPEAHLVYLRGNYFNNRYDVGDWLRAIDFYEQAIRKDPLYAPPYAELAYRLADLPLWGGGTAEELHPRAREAAQTAVELDDTLAMAHIALGYVAISCNWDWALAEREYQRAIELEPGSWKAHLRYGSYLVWMGRSEEGIAEGIHAVELDPLSLFANTQMGSIFFFARRYDEAIEQLTNVLDMDPNYWGAHFWLASTYMGRERYEDALATCQRMGDLAGPTPINELSYAYLYALLGKREEALRIIRAPEWTEMLASETAYARAGIYGALGETDEAFRLLDQAYEVRSPMLATAKVDPRLDFLRDDPRFQDLLRRMNFPE
jgi:TolB-like protein/Flp pilus assembly protein TadD